MFWGLPLEPSKKYTQKVERAFHISHATLDLKASDQEPIQVILEYEGNSFILAHLSKKNNLIQVPLDLNFDVGEQISFRTIGKGRVFLIGYTILEPEDDLENYLKGESDSEAEEETSLDDIQTPGKRKKALTKTNEKKKKKLDVSNEDQDNEDDDSDSDDSSEGMGETTVGDTTLFDDDDDDDSEEDMIEEVEFEEDEDDDEDDDDDNDDSEEEDESEEEPAPAITPKSDKKNKKENQSLNVSVNGLSSKKDKKNKSKVDGASPKKGNETPKKDELSPKKEKQVKTPKQESTQKKTPKSEKSKQNKTPITSASPGTKRVVEGGVIVEDIKEGDGQIAKPGKVLCVHYIGRLKANNKVFDKHQEGHGFKFRLGKGEVIKGWDIGLNGMKAGGKRRITIPSPLAYGVKGCPPAIPPNSTLVFEVDVKQVN